MSARKIKGYRTPTGRARVAMPREIDECTCVEYCNQDPRTACRLSGTPHVHPADPSHPGAYGPCPAHPERPGDH